MKTDEKYCFLIIPRLFFRNDSPRSSTTLSFFFFFLSFFIVFFLMTSLPNTKSRHERLKSIAPRILSMLIAPPVSFLFFSSCCFELFRFVCFMIILKYPQQKKKLEDGAGSDEAFVTARHCVCETKQQQQQQ